MKKNKLLVFLTIPLFAFLLSTSNVHAAEQGNTSWDENVGTGSTTTSDTCSSSNNGICRASGNSTVTQYLYASLTNPASSSSTVVGTATGTISQTVKELNSIHDGYTASKDSVCAFISTYFGISCDGDKICDDKIEYVYFSMSAPVYINKTLVSNYTIKELAEACLNGQYNSSCMKSSTGWGNMSVYFHVTGAYTGVYDVAASKTTSVSTIASISSGYGVAAIRLQDYGIGCEEEKEPDNAICSGYGVAQVGSLNQCSDTNSSTTSTFRDMVSGSGTGSENGVKEYDIGGEGTGYCSLYCLEINATAELPGGFANAISLGSGIVWPTSPNTWTTKFGNLYSLTFKGTRRCYVQVAPNLTYGKMCQVDPVEDYTDAITDLKKAYSDNYDAASAANTARSYVGKTMKATYDHGAGTYTIIDIDSISPGGKTTAYLAASYTNEILRASQSLTSMNSACWKYSGSNDKPDETWPANDCLDTNLWNKYINPATTNIEKLKSLYDAMLEASHAYNTTYEAKYHPPVYEFVTGYKNKQKVQDEYYECESNVGGRDFVGELSGSSCVYSDDYIRSKDAGIALTYEALEKWKSFKSAVQTKQNKFKSYVQIYRQTVNIYLKVKLCSDYSKDEMSCSGSTCTYYNFVTGVDMEYEYADDDYTVVGPLEIEQDVNYTCDNCGKSLADMKKKSYMYEKYTNIINVETPTKLQQYINKIEATPITMESGEVIYSLPSTVSNAYINKNTLEVSDDIPSDANKVLNSFRNLPTSFNNKVGRQYNLVLKNIRLGHNGVMSPTNSYLNLNSSYICHYEVTTTNDECICSTGTKNSGVDLYAATLSGMSCADAQLKYCNADSYPECTNNCFEEKYCPEDYSVKISGCVNSGKTYSWCVENLCSSGYDGIAYRCSSGTNKDMDITSCVEMKVSTGSSQDDAVSYCERTVCQLDNIVIYRTIDLKNPFPSQDADATVTQGGLHIGMFNLNVYGRYPGYNWNGTELVKSKIINNGSTSTTTVTADEIYSQKPLYHFVINSSTILSIRQYNKSRANSNGYNDFTLECITDDSNPLVGSACLSRSFVHNPNYGGDTTGSVSTCGGAGSTTALADCLYNR